MKKEEVIISFMIIVLTYIYEILNRKISFFNKRGDIGEVSLLHICLYVPSRSSDVSETRHTASSYV